MIDYTALCCSSELRTLMKPARGKLPLLATNERVHDEWYADVSSIERRHCVLFLHAPTRYTVMSVAQSVESIRQLRKLFVSSITQQLNAERIASDKQQHILSTWQAIAYRAADDKRLLAALKDRLRDYRLAIDEHGGVLRCDIDWINRCINRMEDSASPAQAFANRFAVELPAIANNKDETLFAAIAPRISPR